MTKAPQQNQETDGEPGKIPANYRQRRSNSNL